jgi:Ca-activated chloride channel family protein
VVKNFKLYNLKLITWLVVATELLFWTISINIYFFIFDQGDEARLENPTYLWFLLVIPFFALFWILNTKAKNTTILRFASIEKLSDLGSKFSNGARFLQYFLIRNVLFFTIIALSNPQYGMGKLEAKRSGIDLIIALDVSNSMLAEDMGPNGNRLINAKRAIERLVSQLKGDRIGLIVFAGDAFVQIPLTNDYGAAKLFLSTVSTDMLSAQGTAIGKAIDKSVESFDPKSKTKKAIIVISDGENHEDDAVAAVQNAINNKINVYTIGVGSTKGSPIPNYVNGVRDGVRRDAGGNTVMTKLNQEMLIELANVGNGIYVKTNRTNFGLEKLFAEINKIEKKTYETVDYTDYDDQYFYFLWIAFLFIIAEFIIGYLPLYK